MRRATIAVPAPAALPGGRTFSDEFHHLRQLALDWICTYREAEHLRRTGDWLLALDPGASEPIVIAALTHDMERAVPGGVAPDKSRMRWDDPAYNAAHCARSAEIVGRWLADQGASGRFVQGVRQPIIEHEFGGSPEGDLIQAADSISFLETNRPLIITWVETGECSPGQARAKLQWMCDRVRLDRGKATARAQLEEAMAEFEEQLSKLKISL